MNKSDKVDSGNSGNSDRSSGGGTRLRLVFRNVLLGGIGGLAGALFWTHSHQAAPSRSNESQLQIAQSGQSGQGEAPAPVESVGTVESGTVEPVSPEEMRRQARAAQDMTANFPPVAASEESACKRICPGANPRARITRFIGKLENKEMPPMLPRANLIFVDDPALSREFPACVFYVIRFAQWPLAMPLAPPLDNNNLFVFDGKGAMSHITERKGLEQFFRSHMQAVTDEPQAKVAVTAWLRLAQELAQDGMYHFSTAENTVNARCVAGKITAEGKCIVAPHGGDMGEITATMTFLPDGKLESLAQAEDLKAGMRPICQSTKLLDRDPLVRRMAEQDILIMGKAVAPYLQEQRKKVSPPLKQAIDRIWQRILKEGR